MPGWTTSTTFDVEAKMDDETFAAFMKLSFQQQMEERRRMLRAILASRFKLKIHHETKVRPIYALVIAKSGPKLKPAESKIDYGSSQGMGCIEVHGGPIESFAFNLADLLGREVVDKTGLTGKYDIKLT
jgi:uncharacterized protein (TIGR03435 family)